MKTIGKNYSKLHLEIVFRKIFKIKNTSRSSFKCTFETTFQKYTWNFLEKYIWSNYFNLKIFGKILSNNSFQIEFIIENTFGSFSHSAC